MLFSVNSFLITILPAGMVSSWHWEAAWFEVFTVSEDKVALIVLSLGLVAVVMIDVEFMSAFLGPSLIL